MLHFNTMFFPRTIVFCLTGLVFLHFCLSLFAGSALGQQNETNRPEGEIDSVTSQAFSFFEGALNNGECLRSGDVLVRRRTTMDTIGKAELPKSDGFIYDETGWTRVTFDVDRNEYAAFSRIDYSLFRSAGRDAETKPDTKSWRTTSGFFIGEDGTDAVFRSFPSPAKTHAKDSIPKINSIYLMQVGFPDFRGAGATPCALTGLGLEQARKFVDWLKTNGSVKRVTHNPDGTVNCTIRVEQGNFYSINEYRFDVEAICLRKISHIGGKVFDTQEELPKGKPETFEWEMRNGIAVPTQIEECEYRMFRPDRTSSEEYPGDVYVDLEFHWFSVNEGANRSLFDKQHLETMTDLDKIVDPNATGARRFTENIKAK